jgi:purine-binding chemotaxis protein CheW
MQGARSGEVLQLVSFDLNGEEYGVDILKVQEIIRMLAITKVPRLPEFVEGVINLRGKVIPVISLRKRFGFEAKDVDKRSRTVVVDIDGKIIGVVVDSVSEVLRLPVDTLEPPPAVVAGKDAKYIRGVGKVPRNKGSSERDPAGGEDGERLLMLLDLSKLLTETEKEMLDAENK